MSKTNTRKCRFCLKTIYDNKFDMMGEMTTQMLNTLLKVNLGIDKETVICLECATKFQSAVDFKTICLTARSNVSSNLKPLSEEENSKQNTGIEFSDISSDQKVCQFCLSLTERGRCTDLQDRKEYVFMIDTVQKHIPELHLNDAKELVTCDTCLSSVQNFTNFIMVCSESEKFRETNRKAAGSQFNLGDNVDFPLRTENVADGRNDIDNNSTEHITVKNEPECEGTNELVQDDGERPAADTSAQERRNFIKKISDQIVAAGPVDNWSTELYNQVLAFRPARKSRSKHWTFQVRPTKGKWYWVTMRARPSVSTATNKKNADLVALEGTICKTAPINCRPPLDSNLESYTSPAHDHETLGCGNPAQNPHRLSASNENASVQFPDPLARKDLTDTSELGNRPLDTGFATNNPPVYAPETLVHENPAQGPCHFSVRKAHASVQFLDSVAIMGITSKLGSSPLVPPPPEVTPIYQPVDRLELCWRCGYPGHTRVRCSGKMRLLCSKCERLEIMSNDCECQSKNRSPSHRTQSPLRRSQSPSRRSLSSLRRSRSSSGRSRSSSGRSRSSSRRSRSSSRRSRSFSRRSRSSSRRSRSRRSRSRPRRFRPRSRRSRSRSRRSRSSSRRSRSRSRRSPGHSRRLRWNNSRSNTTANQVAHDLPAIHHSIYATSGPQPPANVHCSSIGTQCYLYSAPPQIDTTSRGTQCELIW